jgi:nucleoside-diphosphate-sugar epimerase
MKILITGGSGYKGILLTEELLNKYHSVTILDNFMYGYESVLHLVSNPNLTIIPLDIRNLTEKLLKEYDVIYHLAAISGMPACAANPHSAQVINVDATKNLVSCLGNNQILIYASTTSIYGNAGGDCDEDSVVVPMSLYAKTKYEAEKIVQERDNSISLRFATIFGVSPKMRNDLLVNDFTYRAMNDRTLVLFDSHSKRTFMHIKDAISGYLFALDWVNEMCGQVFNVGNSELNLSKLDIANAIHKYVPFEIVDSSLADVDVRNFNVSFKKINTLSYKTNYTLDDGITELIKLYSFYKIYSHFNII